MRRRDDTDRRPEGQFLGRLTVTLWVVCARISLLYPRPHPMLLFSRGGLCARGQGVHMGFSYVLTLFYGVGWGLVGVRFGGT